MPSCTVQLCVLFFLHSSQSPSNYQKKKKSQSPSAGHLLYTVGGFSQNIRQYLINKLFYICLITTFGGILINFYQRWFNPVNF